MSSFILRKIVNKKLSSNQFERERERERERETERERELKVSGELALKFCIN